jgi:hypothetical protein
VCHYYYYYYYYYYYHHHHHHQHCTTIATTDTTELSRLCRMSQNISAIAEIHVNCNTARFAELP